MEARCTLLHGRYDYFNKIVVPDTLENLHWYDFLLLPIPFSRDLLCGFYQDLTCEITYAWPRSPKEIIFLTAALLSLRRISWNPRYNFS
jgi:hypothetical protein